MNKKASNLVFNNLEVRASIPCIKTKEDTDHITMGRCTRTIKVKSILLLESNINSLSSISCLSRIDNRDCHSNLFTINSTSISKELATVVNQACQKKGLGTTKEVNSMVVPRIRAAILIANEVQQHSEATSKLASQSRRC